MKVVLHVSSPRFLVWAVASSMASALFFSQDASKQEVSLFPKLLQHLAMLTASPRPNSSPQQLQYATR